MSEFYAHDRRAEKRDEIKKAVKEKTRIIFSEIWDKATITDNNIEKFFTDIDNVLRDQFKTPMAYQLSRIELNRCLTEQNKRRSKHDKLQCPSIPIWFDHPQLTKGSEWRQEGPKIADIADQAIEFWSTHSEYRPDEVLGWTLLSAILFGALSDHAALCDFLCAIVNKRPLKRFTGNLCALHLVVDDNNYGNNFDNEKLTRPYMFIPDDRTLCWLFKIHQESINSTSKFTVDTLINKVLEQLNTKVRYPENNKANKLLENSSYVWEQIPNAQIDQATSRVLSGLQACCSLSETDFNDFMSPITPLTTPVSLDVRAIFHGSFPDNITKNEVSIPLKQARTITSDLRDALKSDNYIQSLKYLLNQAENENIKRLISWLIDLAQAEHSKKILADTVERYMDGVAIPWLLLTFEQDITLYTTLDFENMYHEILNAKSARSRAYDASLLNRFHEHQVKYFQAPVADLGIINKMQICRSKVISKHVFEALDKTLCSATDVNKHDRRVFRLLLILAFRTGMRRDEIVGIQFRDIERGPELSVIVRPNPIRRIKSTNSYRRIPLYALLKEDELKLLRAHLDEQFLNVKKAMSGVVFSPSESIQEMPSESPSRLFKQLLIKMKIMGDYTFHDFRHTALSNMGLILNAPSELIDHLTDYSPEHCLNIRNALLGHEHHGQENWFALAQVAGHLDPYPTFTSYLHFIHIMGGFSISQGTVEIPFAAVLNITKFSSTRIKNNTEGALDESYSMVDIAKLRPLLIRALLPKTNEQSTEVTPPTADTIVVVPIQPTLDPHTLMFTQLPSSKDHPFAMLQVLNLLDRYQDGTSLIDVAKLYKVPLDLVNVWEKRAKQLANLKTQQGELRLFDKKKRENHPVILLAPELPPSHKEQLLIATFFRNAIVMHQNNSKNLHRFLDIFFDKVSATKGDLRFIKKDIEIFKEFLFTGMELLTAINWGLKAASLEDAQQLKKDLALPRELKIFAATDQNSGYSLSITSPISMEKNRAGQLGINTQVKNRKSSGLLKYVCHMLAITDLSYEIPVNKTPIRD